MSTLVGHNRFQAGRLDRQFIGRVILVTAGPAGVLSDFRKGLFSVKLWVDGRMVKVNRSRLIVS